MFTIVEILTRTAGKMLTDWTGTVIGTRIELLSGQILEALFNGVWQGIALSLVVWAVLRSLPAINSATRHAVWLGTLGAIALLPLAAGQLASESLPVNSSSSSALLSPAEPRSTILSPPVQTSAIVPRSPETRSLQANIVKDPGNSVTLPVPLATTEVAGLEGATKSARLESSPDATVAESSAWSIRGGSWTVGLVVVWALLVLLRLGRLAGSVAGVQSLKQNSTPLSPRLAARLNSVIAFAKPRRSVTVACTDELEVPAVLGLGKPTIVLPRTIISALCPEELDQIVLHELAHINRRDDWIQLGERVVAAFLFFHPALLLVSKRLTLEREIACDDWVLSRQHNRKPYALCLWKLLELRLKPQRALPVPGAFLTRPQIFRRIEMILNKKRNVNTRLSRTGVLAGALLMAAGIVQAAFMTPVIAVAAPPEPQPAARPAPVDPPPALPSVRPVSRAPYALPALPVAPAARVPLASPDYGVYAQAGSKEEQRALMEEQRQLMSEQQRELRNQQREIREAQREARSEARRAKESYRRQGASSGSSWVLFDNFKWNFNGTTITTDDDLTSFSWSRGSHRIRVELEGEVAFTTDDADIANIGDGGFFLIQEHRGRDSKELEIASNRDGTLSYYYFEDRQEGEFDDEAKLWLAEILPFVIRQSGIGAKGRVDRMLSEGGVDLVLQDITLIESDYGQRLYYGFLLGADDFDPASAHKVFRQAGREIDSDYERAELLIRYAEYAHKDPKTLDAFVDAVIDIDSDYETRRVLSAIGTDRELSKHYTAELLDIAGQMDSDYERAELLLELAEFSRGRSDMTRLYVDAVETISSDYEKRRVLSRLLESNLSDMETIDRILAISRTIGSDYERAELLRDIADEASDNDRLMQSYLDASMTIRSDYEKRRVLSALSIGDQVSDELLLVLLDVAAEIGSDYEKAEFLIEYSRHFDDSEAMKDAYADVADTIDSDYERDRVLARLYRRDRKLRRK